ncbi:MAG: DUF2281 domain-containing protein [Cyclobacteriaceae bacterium]|nr:DUF2281 domain-containing protein [Cyclobacteriaceae bacterium]
MTKIQSLEKKILQLPPSTIVELEQFIDELLAKSKGKTDGKLKQDWMGGLKKWRNEFTSLELQKKALEWRQK